MVSKWCRMSGPSKLPHQMVPDLAELVGASPAMETVRHDIRRLVSVAREGRRLPAVLIQGETGTGKGLVARLLHRYGPRARGPFIDLNCAAIPETLLEGELFGYERGAFTGADRTRSGFITRARGGTFLFDEMPSFRETLTLPSPERERRLRDPALRERMRRHSRDHDRGREERRGPPRARGW